MANSWQIHGVRLLDIEAARNNIFYQVPGDPRTLDDMYAYFGKKFNNQRYGDYEVNSSLWLAKN
jgi:hypothetical protein